MSDYLFCEKLGIIIRNLLSNWKHIMYIVGEKNVAPFKSYVGV